MQTLLFFKSIKNAQYEKKKIRLMAITSDLINAREKKTKNTVLIHIKFFKIACYLFCDKGPSAC